MKPHGLEHHVENTWMKIAKNWVSVGYPSLSIFWTCLAIFGWARFGTSTFLQRFQTTSGMSWDWELPATPSERYGRSVPEYTRYTWIYRTIYQNQNFKPIKAIKTSNLQLHWWRPLGAQQPKTTTDETHADITEHAHIIIEIWWQIWQTNAHIFVYARVRYIHVYTQTFWYLVDIFWYIWHKGSHVATCWRFLLRPWGTRTSPTCRDAAWEQHHQLLGSVAMAIRTATTGLVLHPAKHRKGQQDQVAGSGSLAGYPAIRPDSLGSRLRSYNKTMGPLHWAFNPSSSFPWKHCIGRWHFVPHSSS